jgi:rubrerythrin
MAKTKTHHNGAHHDGLPRSRGQSRGRRIPVSAEWMRDFLSEMLAVEKGGVKLYEKARNELKHREFEEQLTEFLHQTEYHVELCTELLKAAGGDEDYRSAGAEAADHKAEGLISTEVPAEMRDLNNIENLVLAETKDHWNWEMLGSVEKKIEDAELKGMVAKAVREVRRQEKTHLDWNERTLTTLAMEAAMQGLSHEAEEGEAMEGSMDDA